MIASDKTTWIKWLAAVLALSLVIGCSSAKNPTNNNSQNQGSNTTSGQQKDSGTNIQQGSPASSPAESATIVYQNKQYGFNFTLPKSWQGYTIITSTWKGNDVKTGKITETGQIISIRHPLWTSQNPRQDIPIMVFTLAQWNSLQKENFHIGAAPIGPKELGRNKSYVFALPARYNFAFPTGYEEVEKILANHPLQAF